MTAGMKPSQSPRQERGSEVAPSGDPSGDIHRTFDLIADGHRHWLRADVRSAHGQLLLLGNPIYLLGQ
jgi:hypothetical protein